MSDAVHTRLSSIRTVEDVVAAFKNEDRCRILLEAMVWPDGRTCPACGSRHSIALTGRDTGKHRARPGLYQCSSGDCRFQFTVLAPTFDSLLRFYEACSDQKIRVGGSDCADLSKDEHRLLELLEGPDQSGIAMLKTKRNPQLMPALRVALRSTRLMIRQVFSAAGEASPLHPAAG